MSWDSVRWVIFFFQAEDGIRDRSPSRGLGDVYKRQVYAPGVNGGEAAASDVYADDFLYDMQKDPWQLNNVVADPAYADVKAELRERLLNWIQHAEGSRPTITD